MNENNLVEEAVYQEPNQGSAPQQPKGIELSAEEKAFIEQQRQEQAKIQAFRNAYQKLVEQTGYAWAVDIQSPINSPKLGLTRVA